MANDLSRRGFIGQGLLAGGALVAGWHVNPQPARASNSALEKLNIGAIGTGNRAAANIGACASQHIIALADVDANFLAAAGEKYKNARKYWCTRCEQRPSA